jgi:glutamate-5-semialdehyde dehydrogenase
MEIKARVIKMAREAKDASRILAGLSAKIKNEALKYMADSLEKKTEEILKENKKDLVLAEKKGLNGPMVERLILTVDRIKEMAQGLRKVADLNDPVGEIASGWKRPNGMEILKIKVPFGLVGIIYESRPNVTADSIGLCLKSGNSILLRGGSESLNSNIKIANILSGASEEKNIPKGCIQIVETSSREAVEIMFKLNEYIDVLIPRGGAELINLVKTESRVPVIETGVGNCHLYVDKDADLKMAVSICLNAKVQRPCVCNAIETLLVHKDIANKYLPAVYEKLKERKVEIRGCTDTRRILKGMSGKRLVKKANEEDWYTEFLDLILAVKVVDTLKEAIGHINRYGSRHSEAIVTNNYAAAQEFLRQVDAACVYVNVSTRFTDGNEFGMGSEIGISTQKLHARGPMGLNELTTTKYVILGNGQIRE